MNSNVRGRAGIFAIPMILAFVAARHAAPSIRTVDFLVVFAAGAVFGATLFGLIRAIRARG
ncbi:MAG TPA: hypothetical protein VF363_08085 [Candidatus Eisenbacteria bacterium]